MYDATLAKKELQEEQMTEKLLPPDLKKNKVEIKIDDFKRGVNRLVEATRLKEDEAVEATNLMLDQDGVYTVRWGTEYYTPAIDNVSEIMGFHEYIASDGTSELILVGDDGCVYKSLDGASPSKIPEA
jgi:hypothetical protein